MNIDNIKEAIFEGLKLKEKKIQEDFLEKERLNKIKLEKELEEKNRAENDAINTIHYRLPILIKDAVASGKNIVDLYIGYSNMSKDQKEYYSFYEQFIKDELKKLKLTFKLSTAKETEVLREDPYSEAEYYSYWLSVTIPLKE